ncbi:MAG: serine hydrolase, partial [Beijerinckiaceae bacterium]
IGLFSRTLLSAIFFACAGIAMAHAAAPVLVVDAASGQVLIAEDATRPWKPASTTKMMTAFVALRAVKTGRLTLDTPLIASSRASGQKPSKIGIRPGQEITLDNALKIMMVRSANDLAVVIAEAVGGSIEGFSGLMNAEARRLGMNESNFSNPHGFDAPGHQTSARDLALLARAMLVEMPEFRDYWGIGAVQLGNRTLNNTNGLIGRYSGASGMKTGFVCASGFNLVSTATRGGRTLIAVVLGAGSGGERTVRSAQVLDQAFGTWNGSGQTLRTLPSSGYSSAPNMRGEICSGRRRGVVLADDSDYGGAIFADTASQGDSLGAQSQTSFFLLQAGAQASPSYGIRSSNARTLLGPRSGVVPIAVYLGRAPGSTAVAVGPGARAVQAAVASAPPIRPGAVPGLPDSASALAPVGIRQTLPETEVRPAAAAAIRPASAPAAAAREPVKAEAEEARGEPLQLPGVITTGPKPGAAAGIRPRTAALPTPTAGNGNPAEKARIDKAKADKAKAEKAKAAKAAAAKKKAAGASE